MTSGLVFYPKAHRYKLDGEWVPGVTTAIGKGMPKPALTKWAAKSVAEWVADHDAEVEQLRGMGRNSLIAALKEVPWTARDRAAIRGTDIHALGDKLVRGEAVEVPDHLADHVSAYLRWLDTWQPRAVAVERPCASRRWKYAGTFDLVADLPEGPWTTVIGTRPLLDLKSSESGIFPEAAIQLAAYRYSDFYVDENGDEQPTEDLGITGAAALWVRADGVEVVPLRSDEHVFKRFLHIKTVAACAEEARSYVGQPLPWPETAGAA